jgi:hypothetical protein
MTAGTSALSRQLQSDVSNSGQNNKQEDSNMCRAHRLARRAKTELAALPTDAGVPLFVRKCTHRIASRQSLKYRTINCDATTLLANGEIIRILFKRRKSRNVI